MNALLDQSLVAGVVLASLLYLLLRFRKKKASGKSCGGDCCGGSQSTARALKPKAR